MCETFDFLNQEVYDYLHLWEQEQGKSKELLEALEEIANSKYQCYDENEANQYGIGVTDGHRFCGDIARAAIAKAKAR